MEVERTFLKMLVLGHSLIILVNINLQVENYDMVYNSTFKNPELAMHTTNHLKMELYITVHLMVVLNPLYLKDMAIEYLNLMIIIVELHKLKFVAAKHQKMVAVDRCLEELDHKIKINNLGMHIDLWEIVIPIHMVVDYYFHIIIVN